MPIFNEMVFDYLTKNPLYNKLYIFIRKTISQTLTFVIYLFVSFVPFHVNTTNEKIDQLGLEPEKNLALRKFFV